MYDAYDILQQCDVCICMIWYDMMCDDNCATWIQHLVYYFICCCVITSSGTITDISLITHTHTHIITHTHTHTHAHTHTHTQIVRSYWWLFPPGYLNCSHRSLGRTFCCELPLCCLFCSKNFSRDYLDAVNVVKGGNGCRNHREVFLGCGHNTPKKFWFYESDRTISDLVCVCVCVCGRCCGCDDDDVCFC